MSVVVELLGVVDAEVAETGGSLGGVADVVECGIEAVAEVELLRAAVGVGAVVVEESASVDGEVAGGVDLVVDVDEDVAAKRSVTAGGGIGLV